MFVILSLDNCGFCIKSKKLLDSKGIKYEELNAREAIKEYPYKTFNDEELLNKNAQGRITVPIIFWKDETDELDYIGGYDDLVLWLQDQGTVISDGI